MGRDRHEKHRKNKLPPFVPMLIDTLDSRAWRKLSHGARSLYLALRRRYSQHSHNNGRLFLSQRHAQHELGSNRTYIARWYRELQHYGFIVMTSPGCLGVDGKGKAPTWRLTELGTHADSYPTRDFMKWDGTKFRDRQPTEKQNPGPQTGATVDHKLVPVVDHKLVPPDPESGPQTGAIEATEGGPQKRSITSKPLLYASLQASPQLIAVEERKERERVRRRA